ncbi:FimV/HubP family polar landmark protein [Marinobacterium sp. YM272]|uniref:FimV/HubP family polar landmark protein n=1 Tax=Marinobacterium sp. YM272 TaxID=3421654 RepID=UPI003D7F8D38
MLRKLALSLAVAGALSATQANALGLGTIQVNSALNEPLNAEIKLLQVRDLSPLQIQPRMADIDEFSLAGISKSRFLSDVKFDVQVLPNGTGVIRLNSSTPIKEPFLNFLVEVNWPSGRLVREYTLLLDPPLFDPTPAPGSQTLTPAQSSAPITTQSSQPVSRVSSSSSAATGSASTAGTGTSSNIQTRVNPNTEVYVDVRDTLWELALEHRPNRSVTPEQMMLALQRKNPQSFPSNNINFLKAGTVMRLPSLDEIKALSAAEARQEASRQTQVWREGRASARNTAAEPVDKTTEKATESSEKSVETAAAGADEQEAGSQLKVVTPEAAGEGGEAASVATASQVSQSDAEQSQAGGDEGVAGGETAEGADTPAAQALAERNEELENRLLLTQESVARVELENAELNDKIDSVASQLDKMQKLIELKDRELALMQQQMDQRAAEDDEAAGIVDQMLNNPAYLAGAGGAALLAFLLGLMLARRGKGSNDDKAEASKPEQTGTGFADKNAESDAIPDMAIAAAAGAAGAAGAAVVASAAEEEKETAAEEEPVAEGQAEISDLADDDLSDLDLDMDLDLDETASTETAEQPATINDDEFDLGVDDLTEEPAPETEDEIDSSLDDLLSEDSADDDELPGPLDGFDADDALADFDTLEEPEAEVEAENESSETGSDELDFAVAGFGADEGEAEDDVLDLPDDLEFDVNQPLDSTDESASEADDGLAGLDFAVEPGADEGADSGAGGDDDFLLEGFFDEDVPEKGDTLSEVSDEDVEPLTDAPLDVETLDDRLTLGTVEPLEEPDDSALDDGLDEMLLNSYGDEEEGDSEPSVDEDDLDALLADFEPEEEEVPQREQKPGEKVEEELTANIAHDLEADLDSELDALLDSTDDDIALEEENATESSDQADDPLDSLNLLEGADENETKLDLARAYIEMEDREGAKDILNEILGEGNHYQRREAQRLLDSLNG